MIIARKMPEFYITIARKIFFPNFRGHVPCPLSPTPICSLYPIYACLYAPGVHPPNSTWDGGGAEPPARLQDGEGKQSLVGGQGRSPLKLIAFWH